MRAFLFFVALLTVPMGFAQMTFDEAWTKVQGERDRYGKVLNDDAAKPDAIREALAGLETLKAWCLSEGIRDLKNSGGQRNVYYQRNDILVDQVFGYARLKEVDRVVACLKELRDSLIAPDSWVKGSNLYIFGVFANKLQNDPGVAKLLPNAEIDAILSDLKHSDPNWMFNGAPFSLADTDRLSVADRVAGLSTIWSEAKYNFANFDLVKDLDWDASYQRFLPLVIAAKDRYAYYDLLREFVGLLRDSHTNVFLPPSLSSNEVRPSLPVGLVEGKVVVNFEPSPDFRRLGFRRGDIVERIDGVDAVEYGRKRWGKLVAASTPQDRDMRLYTYMLLRGPQKKAVNLEVSGVDGKVRKVAVPRDGSLKGTPLPSSEFKILPDGTAYFVFNTCSTDEPSQSFVKNLPEIQKAGKLVIDCRMNDGGNSNVGYEILRHLIDEPVKAGQWQTRTYQPSLRAWRIPVAAYGGTETVQPKGPRFEGPVVVLAGPRTFSAGEDFLAAFKMSKRGIIVGMPTGGSTGQPLTFRLPGGGSGRICTKRDRMGDGTEFVGIGIFPDQRIEPTIASLRTGNDLALEAALRYLAAKLQSACALGLVRA